jgi:hypothetical protein
MPSGMPGISTLVVISHFPSLMSGGAAEAGMTEARKAIAAKNRTITEKRLTIMILLVVELVAQKGAFSTRAAWGVPHGFRAVRGKRGREIRAGLFAA